MSAHLQPVDPARLPDYPLDRAERLESHWFMPWERRRWLNSDMRLRGTPECRAHYFDLICISFDHAPIGTLPRDLDLLARMLMVDAAHFRQICHLEFGPLHSWQPCNCDGEVRLMHPVVISTIQEQISRKHDNRARTEAASRSRRRQRLRSDLGQLAPELAANDGAVLWVDEWLEREGVRKRTSDKLRAAVSAWMQRPQARGGRVF